MLHHTSFLCFFLLLQSSISAPVSDSESSDDPFNEVGTLIGEIPVAHFQPPVAAAQNRLSQDKLSSVKTTTKASSPPIRSSAPLSDSESSDCDSESSDKLLNGVGTLVGGIAVSHFCPPLGAVLELIRITHIEDERFEKKQNDLQAAVTAKKLIGTGALCIGTIIAGVCTVAGATMGPAGAVGGAVLGAKIGGSIAGAGVLGLGVGHAAQHVLDTIAKPRSQTTEDHVHALSNLINDLNIS